MKSVMSHDFSRVPSTSIPRSAFDRSHGVKTTFDSGWLVPVEVQEVLPGDHITADFNCFARLMPAVVPVMDNVFLDLQAFYCPSRLLWTNFVKMMGERINPNDSIDYLCPTISSGPKGFAVGSLADYFGIPTGIKNLTVNALPFRMYSKVFDDWYRDENLQDSIIQTSEDLGDGNPRNIQWNTLRRRGKRHDYFTSCLPWPQKGEGVELSIGGQAPVYGMDYNGVTNNRIWVTGLSANGGQDAYNQRGYFRTNSGVSGTNLDAGVQKVGDSLGTAAALKLMTKEGFNYAKTVAADPMGQEGPGIYADLSSATAATINSLRMAFQLQKLLEKDARSGTRFCEILRGHFGTICPDARLQRSEYLGGSSTPIQFNPIAQTSGTMSEGTPQGNLVSNPKVFGTLHIDKAFTEHGYLLVVANVRCDLNYQQGLNRMWSRRGRYDFFWPVLQNIGEQAVLNKEIYAQGTAVDDDVFGYQERYAEYRYNPSIVTGKLRSTASASLDVWHLAQKFNSLPTLSPEFIEDNPPLKRILAVTDEPEIIMDCYHKQIWSRPMGTYSIPGLIDHL